MNAVRTASPAPEMVASSIAGLTAIVPGSNQRTEDKVPARKAATTKVIRMARA